jgi:PadR family transcriptional regulator, regulatory protein PadR
MARGGYLGELEQIVLLAVARLEGDAYGMSIRREIESRTGRSVAIGAVYSTLERLQDKGFTEIVRPRGNVERDGRARKFFAITGAGVGALDDAAAMQTRMWAGLRLRKRKS